MTPENEVLYDAEYEENSTKQSDLYLLTMDMLAKKITFEEWISKTIVWAKEIIKMDNQENKERGNELP
jgi:phage pi2 protein 07